uniref:Uncharacterized protein n=1 Tax=Coccidioides posadasii RMSCC 3488 TaxID=454284 RepID=A0A0J6F6L0_COCPO|nr:hypothetical protein CPAG_01262 [Coccidioides posadasii RMSCC 3488]
MAIPLGLLSLAEKLEVDYPLGVHASLFKGACRFRGAAFDECRASSSATLSPVFWVSTKIVNDLYDLVASHGYWDMYKTMKTTRYQHRGTIAGRSSQGHYRASIK